MRMAVRCVSGELTDSVLPIKLIVGPYLGIEMMFVKEIPLLKQEKMDASIVQI